MTTFPDPQLTDREWHTKFAELCALHTSGELTDEELTELDHHLANCLECRSLLSDYRTSIEIAIPHLIDTDCLDAPPGFEQELAATKTRLLSQLEDDSGAGHARGLAARSWHLPGAYAIAFTLLAGAISFGGYVFGVRQSIKEPSVGTVLNGDEARLRVQLSETSSERDRLASLVTQQAHELQQKSVESSRRTSEIEQLKQRLEVSVAVESHDATAIDTLKAENSSLRAEHEGAAKHLQEAQLDVAQLQQQLDQLRSDRHAFQAENSTQDRKIEELTGEISEQQRLLLADKDIRNLMGARDLLISDVIDVDTKGRSKKPFGRIFYTKSKSLVFYAFDLDKQPGIRNAGTFQAWGARATSKGNESPVSMGLFYMDNATAQRWVLKLDDPKLLGQIDSVFVTVEPAGGSNKPSGKQLLFTYLRGEANHP